MNVVDLVRYWGAWRPDHPALIFGDLVAVVGRDGRPVGRAGPRPRRPGRRPRRPRRRAHDEPARAHPPGPGHAEARRDLRPAQLPPHRDRDDAAAGRRRLPGRRRRTALSPISWSRPRQQLPFTTFALDSTDRPAVRRPRRGSRPGAVGARSRTTTRAFICYTSGTTGVQKGALLDPPQRALPGPGQGARRGADAGGTGCSSPSPSSTRAAMVSCFMQFVVYAGGTLVLEADFDPDRYLEMIERHRVTAAHHRAGDLGAASPTSPDFTNRDISSLVSAVVGGAPVRLDLLEAFRARGIDLIQAYGLTEARGLAATIRREDAINHIGFAGKPLIGTEIRIGDDEGRTVPARGGRRDPRQGAARDAGVLAQAGGHGPDHRGRVAALGRPRAAGRRRLPQGRRPHEGHADLGRHQRLPGRDREGAGRHRRRHRPGRDRRARRPLGRDADGRRVHAYP